MSSIPKDIYCFEFTVLFTKLGPCSCNLNVLCHLSLEIRELFLFTVLLKLGSILPFLFSDSRCTKKRMPSAILVPISYSAEVAIFVLKHLEKPKFHSQIGIQISYNILSK